MRARLLLAAVLACAALALPAQALGADEYGFESVAASATTSQAGGHPDLTTTFVLKSHAGELGPAVNAPPKDIDINLPPGLIGNPNAIPKCTTAEFFGLACPADSQAGVTGLLIERFAGGIFHAPVFSLKPPSRDVVARLGFLALFNPVIVDIRIRSGSDYGITASVVNANDQLGLISAETTLWGVPAAASHNTERVLEYEAIFCSGSGEPCLVGGSRESGLALAPFLTNPTSCGPLQVGFSSDSYMTAGSFVTASAPLAPITGCDKVGFAPRFSATPTTATAGAPTGLEAKLELPQDDAYNSTATAELRGATVTLPPGMTIAPGAADGLAACGPAEVGFGSDGPSGCPQAAKLGTATFVSPNLSEPLQGAIYQRTPESGHLFRIWLVADDLGVHLKIPGEVRADPSTGQLTSIFVDTPQLPVELIELRFKDGARAPLKNPDQCGTALTHYELTPWSGNAPAVGDSPMAISGGCRAAGFAPTLRAGTTNAVAGAYAAFVADVKREDGEQNISTVQVTPPPGELAKLAGVPLCVGAAAAGGDCPAASRVGSVKVATGPGSLPLWLPQPGREPTAAYLSGPYEGAPYSLVFKVPAQAGPFDLGTVITRAAVLVDPETTRVIVRSDPLPQILEGVPIAYRTVHVEVDRHGFALNPTSCRAMSVNARITSILGAGAAPRDRFQVGDCAALGFRPALSLRLKGKTGRGAFPGLRAVLRMPAHGANIARAQVALPHSEFLEQAHIRTICTRVQFAANECPAGAVYGHARAITPLLDRPLEGPVYLRSSSHQLPDLVADLHGQIHVVLDGRIDSVKGGIRTTFSRVPDAPVSKFILTMKGGKRGLLVNSSGLCGRTNLATAHFTGQNGKVRDFQPRLRDDCGK